MPALNVDDLQDRIASDPIFAHRVLFEHANLDAPFHTDLINLYHGPHQQVVALCFRDAAKSTICEEAMVIGALTKAFDYAVIVCSTERRAADRLFSISNAIEKNEMIEEIYGADMRGPTWHTTRIVLANGVCIDAIGVGQNTRCMKYLSFRPSWAFFDDIEEMNQTNDSVSTPEKREDLQRWFRSFVPSLARPYRLRIAGTMLHEESLIARCVRSERYKSLVVPIEVIGPQGVHVASWPDKFPLDWIDNSKSEAEAEGQLETWAQEYLCQAARPQSHAFREEHFRFQDRTHTWEPVFVLYDPARTVGPKSDATGKVVASATGGKILVWEASANHWQPSELIDDIFAAAAQYHPIAIGVEVTGLNQFIEQPLRQAQLTRGSLPIRPMNPPRGPGKEGFLSRLQPFFNAGEVVFCGLRQKFEPLIKELLGFPYGHDDVLNALAYVLEIKPGEAIFDSFNNRHVIETSRLPQWAQKTLLLHSDGMDTIGILVATHQDQLLRKESGTRGGITTIIADWHEAASPAHVIPSLARSARIFAGTASLPATAPPEHFKPYDSIGLVPAAQSAGMTITQGGGLIEGRDRLHEMMMMAIGQEPAFQVSREASWTLRALSGGYATEPGKTVPSAGPYKLIGEALESFAASSAQMGEDAEPNAVTAGGVPFLSSMPHAAVRRRNRELA